MPVCVCFSLQYPIAKERRNIRRLECGDESLILEDRGLRKRLFQLAYVHFNSLNVKVVIDADLRVGVHY